jgi:hypothetical protein
MVVARKIPAQFETQPNGREDEFYADLLAHLLKNRFKRPGRLVFNVAERGSSTRATRLWRKHARIKRPLDVITFVITLAT